MINPAVYTRWSLTKDQVTFKITITGIYSTGTADKFRVTAYELKYDHMIKRQKVDTDKVYELIKTGQLQPLYDKKGSMEATEELKEQLNKI